MAITDPGPGSDRRPSVLTRARALVRRPPVRVPSDPGRSRRALDALDAVAAVEAAEATLPAGRTRTLFVVDRVIGPEVLPARVRTMLPSPYRQDWDVHALPAERAERHLAADLVVHAKYDLGTTVKLRAAYADVGLVVGVLPVGPFGSCGVSRTVTAHAIVSQHAPDLAPGLVAAGEVADAGRYIVERWVDGRPLMSPTRLARAVPAVVEGLHRVHRGHGISRVPLSHWAPALDDEWESLRGTGLVPDPLIDTVASLIEDDLTLRFSWTHGDPVSSNVIETDTGIVLIDWENAANAPVMVDGAKLHLLAGRPQETLSTILSGLSDPGDPTGRGAYSPQQELALAHARTLVAHPRRARRLVGHPRAEAFTRQGRRQVERLAEALAA